MRVRATWKWLAAYYSLALLYFSPVNAQTWDALRVTVRKRFPNVRQLSTQNLAAWRADTNRNAGLLLVDAREPAEFGVSHLEGARNLTGVSAVKAAVSSNAQPVVVYCSVGYRSSALADKLQKAGLTNVFNLEGSIFAWATKTGRYSAARPNSSRRVCIPMMPSGASCSSPLCGRKPANNLGPPGPA